MDKNTKAKEAAQKKLALHRAEISDAYKHVMSTPQGRLFVSHLINECGVIANPATTAGMRTNETFYQSGKHSIGVVLQGAVKTESPANYVKMIEESLKRESI